MKTLSINQRNKGTGEAFFRRLILKSLKRNPVENLLQNISSRFLKKLTHVLARDNLEPCYVRKVSTRPT